MSSPGRERLAEFHSEEVVAVCVSDINDFRLEIAGAFGDGSRGGQRGAGYFKRNLRQGPKRAVDRNQSSAGGDVHRGGELQKIFAVFTMTADENRNGKRKTIPRASFHFRLFAIQTVTPLNRFLPMFRTFGAKQITEIRGINRLSAMICRNSRAGARFHLISLALGASVLPVFQVNVRLRIGKHLPKVTNILHFSLTLHSFVA